jgi:hypothetical protein
MSKWLALYREIRPNALWDFIKLIFYLLIIWAVYTGYQIRSWLAGVPSNVVFDVSVLFGLSLTLLVLFIYAKRRKPKKQWYQTPEYDLTSTSREEQSVKREERPVMPIVILIIAGAAIGGVLGWRVGLSYYGKPVPPPSIPELFDRISKRGNLGDPISEIEPVRMVIQAEHENATVILPSKPQRVYLLYDNASQELADWRDEGIDSSDPSDSLWLKEAETIKKFREKFGEERGTPSDGLHPPYGPIAKGWYNHPDQYERIGWRKTHCLFETDVVYLREYQNGLIVGVLRHMTKQTGAQFGRVLILLTKEHRWDDMTDTASAGPECKTPRDH